MNKKASKLGLAKLFATRRAHFGYCPICAAQTMFAKYHDWLRDHYRCVNCWSIPRERALIKTLQELIPELDRFRVLESSPGNVSSKWIENHCGDYVPTHYFTDVENGKMSRGFRCENLECLTFADSEFDLVVTQDVMEHVLDPPRAFSEIARVLRPGGKHVFTVPIYDRETSLQRARYGEDGLVENLMPPEFHGNPIDKSGSLVVTEWGNDIAERIREFSGMTTERLRFNDSRFGLVAEFLDVLVSSRADQAND